MYTHLKIKRQENKRLGKKHYITAQNVSSWRTHSVRFCSCVVDFFKTVCDKGDKTNPSETHRACRKKAGGWTQMYTHTHTQTITQSYRDAEVEVWRGGPLGSDGGDGVVYNRGSWEEMSINNFSWNQRWLIISFTLVTKKNTNIIISGKTDGDVDIRQTPADSRGSVPVVPLTA